MLLPFILNSQNADSNGGSVNVGITGTVDGIYINEFHYDNTSTDTGEFVEVAGPAGTDLSVYTITLYRDTGPSYDTVSLSGTIDNEGSGVGAVSFPIAGIQNGPADGIALSKTGSNDIQLISYEGTLTATNGAASGLLSADINVSEPGSTPVGYSLEYDETLMFWVGVIDDTPGDYLQGTFILSNTKSQIEGFNLFPNPVSEGFVNISSRFNDPIRVSVYDVLGKQVINQVLLKEHIDVSNLTAGVYLLRATQNEGVTTKKLIIK